MVLVRFNLIYTAFYMQFIPTHYTKQMNIQANQIRKNQRNFKNLMICKKKFHKQVRERERE
jgi:hypothetical protein